MTDQERQLENLNLRVGELLTELRTVRREGIPARLTPAQLDEIAYRILEHLDDRLAPRNEATRDLVPRRRRRRR